MIIEKIVKIFIQIDNKYLMKLIKGQNGAEICRSILDLVHAKEIKLNNIINNNLEGFGVFQKILLSVAKNKNEVEFIIKNSKGLIPCLNIINDNPNHRKK